MTKSLTTNNALLNTTRNTNFNTTGDYMKILFTKTLSVLLLFSSLASAEVIEVKNMNSILPFIKQDTLVVFDLDNTIMETPQMLGSDQWFDHAVETKIHSGENKALAVDTVARLWSHIQLSSNMQLVEPETASIINYLQQNTIEVIALTARPEDMFDRTRQQLKENGVTIKDLHTAGNKSKGDALVDIIQKKYPQIKSIVFIDDKLKHAQTVNEALNRYSNITHYEFRYSFADDKVKSYSPSVAECQLEKFLSENNLVPDSVCF